MRFGFVDALKSIDLDLFSQEVVAIVGDNGAGKSTLVKVIAGLQQPNEGSIIMQGEEVRITSVRDASSRGIASVFQNQEFCDNLNVAANLFLGQELEHNAGIRDDESMISKAREVLATLTESIRVGQPINALSVGQRQTVALARTLLDEPTASLSVMQVAEVLSYIKRLRSEGRCVLMVCHDLPDVFAVADRIVVLRQGHIIGVHRTEDTSYEHIIAQIAGVSHDEEMADNEGAQRYGSLVGQSKLINRTMRNRAEHTDEQDA